MTTTLDQEFQDRPVGALVIVRDGTKRRVTHQVTYHFECHDVMNRRGCVLVWSLDDGRYLIPEHPYKVLELGAEPVERKTDPDRCPVCALTDLEDKKTIQLLKRVSDEHQA